MTTHTDGNVMSLRRLVFEKVVFGRYKFEVVGQDQIRFF
jgi:hypothetical protein